MNQLKQMLEAYRNKERGLPTYDELAAIAYKDDQAGAAAQQFKEVSAFVAPPNGVWVNTGSGRMFIEDHKPYPIVVGQSGGSK